MKNFIDILNEIKRVRIVASEAELNKINAFSISPKKKKKKKGEEERSAAAQQIQDELAAKKAARREELMRMGLIPRDRSSESY